MPLQSAGWCSDPTVACGSDIGIHFPQSFDNMDKENSFPSMRPLSREVFKGFGEGRGIDTVSRYNL